MLDHRVLRQERDGTVAVHADVSEFARHRSNDMLVDAAGRAYVGDFGFDSEAAAPDARRPVPASLTSVSPDGAVTEAASGLMFPNGMALTPDGGTMIVAETYGARLTAFNVAPDGTLSGRRIWADLRRADVYPDGICLDADGAVWYADVARRHCVRVREGGAVLATAETDRGAFSCALSRGADPRLFVVGQNYGGPGSPEPSGQLVAFPAPAPGAGRP